MNRVLTTCDKRSALHVEGLKRSLQINELSITCNFVSHWLPLSRDFTKLSRSELSRSYGLSRNLFERIGLAISMLCAFGHPVGRALS